MNNRNRLRGIAFIGLLHVVLMSCDKGNKPKGDSLPIEQIGSVQSVAGFGKQEGNPEGIPFQLPKGLRFVSRDSYPFDPSIERLFGNMNTFYADINIVSDPTWDGGHVEFPAGLIMLNISPSGIQNGMLMGRVCINVPPNIHDTEGDTTTVYLGVACMNATRGFPWEDNFADDTKNYVIGKGKYRPSVVTTEPEVLKFISLLNDRPGLKLVQHQNPWDAFDEDYVEPEWMKPYNAIQLAFWKMTDGGGLSAPDLNELLTTLDQYSPKQY
ncbi:hypothetical protein [Sphingobacterium puteale]|uniref:hypothetical protein n=1 Tax=Sphingobacterium puteale TaxID=2420510 RepID=UPI003D95C510